MNDKIANTAKESTRDRTQSPRSHDNQVSVHLLSNAYDALPNLLGRFTQEGAVQGCSLALG